MVALFDIISFISFHLFLIIFMILTILTSRKKILPWIFYSIGAIFHLLVIIGVLKSNTFLTFDISVYIIFYIAILIVAAILAISRAKKLNKRSTNDQQTIESDESIISSMPDKKHNAKFSFAWLTIAILFIAAELGVTIVTNGITVWSFALCLISVIIYLFCEKYKNLYTLIVAIFASALTVLSYILSIYQINIIASLNYSFYYELFDINMFCYIAFWTSCGLIQILRLIRQIKERKVKRKQKINFDIINILFVTISICFVIVSLFVAIDSDFLDAFWFTMCLFYIPAIIIYLIFRFTRANLLVLPIISFSLNIVGFVIDILIACESLSDYGIYTFIVGCYLIVRLIILAIDKRKVLLSKYHKSLHYKMRCLRKIEKLELLKEKGIISEDEFYERKEEMLNK